VIGVGKKVAFHTLGCKLNFAETSTIARLFEKEGFEKVEFPKAADVYVINTCSVTENADKECKTVVKTALKNSPEAFVAIIGCYAQLKPEEIAKIEGVDVVLGASEKFKLLNYIQFSEKKQETEIHSCEIDDVQQFISSYSAGDRTRSFLKVQDGCDYTCSYCTIPLARGLSRSDTISNVVENAKKIALTGIKEIVLTGVNIGDFGFNHLQNELGKKQEKFLDLIKELDNVEGIERFRISSIEPNLLKDEIIEFVSQSKRFVPHFHVPLQSGSNKILNLMRRRYLRELYVDRVTKIKQLMPHACIGVDVIVGFPGETEEDFIETYNFINQLNISYLHVFTYSERENTDAALMQGKVPVSERKKRNKMLRILSAKKTRAFYEEHLTKNYPVLMEHENKNDFMFGFTPNYIKIKLPYQKEYFNRILDLKLNSIDADGSVIAEFKEQPAII
jgi:threonylcarbamoyladenosine tRNA methylthiotransferase MtaB